MQMNPDVSLSSAQLYLIKEILESHSYQSNVYVVLLPDLQVDRHKPIPLRWLGGGGEGGSTSPEVDWPKFSIFFHIHTRYFWQFMFPRLQLTRIRHIVLKKQNKTDCQHLSLVIEIEKHFYLDFFSQVAVLVKYAEHIAYRSLQQKYCVNQELVDCLLSLSLLAAEKPRENYLTRKDRPVKGNYWFFFFWFPHAHSARVVCCFLSIASILFTGSRINRDSSSLACLQLHENFQPLFLLWFQQFDF